jgi:hypothetical protein
VGDLADAGDFEAALPEDVVGGLRDLALSDLGGGVHMRGDGEEGLLLGLALEVGAVVAHGEDGVLAALLLGVLRGVFDLVWLAGVVLVPHDEAGDGDGEL